MSDTSDTNRRSFFRLEDRIYIDFAPISKEKAEALTAEKQSLSPRTDNDSLYIDTLNKEMGNLMTTVRSENPAVAHYLEVLNKKVDFLSGMLFFEQFKQTSIGEKTIRTYTVDISEGGLSFNSKAAIKDGLLLRMKIIVTGARLGIETIVRVVNSIPKKKGKLNYFRVGVDFPYFTEEDRRSLSRYILERQREKIRSLSEIDDWDED